MLQNNKAKGGDMEQMNRLLGDGGMMDDSGEKVNGVEVPVGSLKEEVADDIPAQLSEGEFVVPADVVRFIGLEKLMQLRDKAKQGLLRMEEMGQMGNAQEVEDPDQSFMQDDEDFGSEIDDIMAEDEPAGFKTGGFITGSDISRVPSNPAVAVGYYKHSDGRMMWITKINGKPMSAPPDGFNEVSAEEFQSVGKKADEAAAKVVAKPSTSTGMTGASGQSDGPVGGDGDGSSSSSSTAGPNALGNTALGLADAAEALSGMPSVAAQLGGAAVNALSQAQANASFGRADVANDAMQQANSVPGMQSSVNQDGKVTTFSTPATIAKSDAAMFTPTPMESLNESLADSTIGTQAANTGMATNAQGQTVSNNATVAAQDAATFGVIGTSQGLGSAAEAAATGMTSVDGVSVSNDASIAAQDAATFGVDAAASNSGGGGSSGRYCCSRMVHHGLWDVNHEFARLTVWSRRQPNWWRSGYPVWGKVLAKNLLKEKGFFTDLVQAFYDVKVRKQPRSIKSTIAEIMIYPGVFVCGMIYKDIPTKATLADPSEFI